MRQEMQEPLPLQLLLVGDVMLGRLVNDILKEQPPTYPWGDTLPLFHEADMRLCNLECALSDGGIPWSATPKMFHFRSDAQNVETLATAHIDAVSLANNHVLDFDEEGLLHMLSTLKEAGIRYAGAGATFREASAPAIWTVKERTIGLLALTDNEPAWAATDEQPGVWYVPIALQDKRAKELFEAVRRIRAAVDVLIVSAHWGPNWGYDPPAEHIPFAHALVDAGADVVFGHSGHVVRGIELYKDKPILYCTGNFIDDYAVDEVERNDQSCVFVLEIEGAAISRLRLYPTIIRQFQARRAQHDERRVIAATMRKLCAKLHTATKWNEQEGCLEICVK
ncbi:MAG TPA: CapA family protein [Ktedonobacteraceae bacterium]|nr:CapA family protein [Ktedonobacteraceae bacterium]